MATGRKHSTCIDVTAIDKPKESEFVCGPDCPKVDVVITWDAIVAMYHKLTPPAYRNE
jgi:hypothetical protein